MTIGEKIADKQNNINELKKIKQLIEDNINPTASVFIETKHFHTWFQPEIIKYKHKLNINTDALVLLIDEIIYKEERAIDKIINNETKKRSNK